MSSSSGSDSEGGGDGGYFKGGDRKGGRAMISLMTYLEQRDNGKTDESPREPIKPANSIKEAFKSYLQISAGQSTPDHEEQAERWSTELTEKFGFPSHETFSDLNAIFGNNLLSTPSQRQIERECPSIPLVALRFLFNQGVVIRILNSGIFENAGLWKELRSNRLDRLVKECVRDESLSIPSGWQESLISDSYSFVKEVFGEREGIRNTADLLLLVIVSAPFSLHKAAESLSKPKKGKKASVIMAKLRKKIENPLFAISNRSEPASSNRLMVTFELLLNAILELWVMLATSSRQSNIENYSVELEADLPPPISSYEVPPQSLNTAQNSILPIVQFDSGATNTFSMESSNKTDKSSDNNAVNLELNNGELTASGAGGRQKATLGIFGRIKSAMSLGSSAAPSNEATPELSRAPSNHNNNEVAQTPPLPSGPSIQIHSKQKLLVTLPTGKRLLVDRYCPHKGADMADGKLKGCNLVCPKHKWSFDLEHGGLCSEKMVGISVCPYQDW